MKESNNQPPQDRPGIEVPLKKLWDVLMFRILVLPTLLKVLNALALLSAVIGTVGIVFGSGKHFSIVPIIWMYIIAIRIMSELVLLCYNFLIQRTQNK